MGPEEEQMAKCSHCGQRKGKRTCPALVGDICSPCCGKHRGREIDCPEDCRFLGGGPGTTRNAVNRMLDRVLKYATRRKDLGEDAMDLFLGPERKMEEWQQSAAIQHLLFCFRGADGRTIAEHFQREHGKSLPSAERDALTAYMDSRFSMFEVREVRTDEGLGVRDLVLGDDLFVNDRSSSHSVQRLDVLMGWVMRWRGRNEFACDSTRLSRLHREAVHAAISGHVAEAGEAEPDASAIVLLQGAVAPAYRALGEAFQAPRMPQLRTSDGEDLVFCKAVHDIDEPAAVRTRLSGHPDLDQDDDHTWSWSGPASPSQSGGTGLSISSTRIHDGRPSLGSIEVRDGRLILETMSRERLDKGKAMIAGLLGDLVRHRVDSIEDVEQAMEQRRGAPPVEREEIPLEIQEELAGGFMQEHLEQWVDEPIPALGGQTPRRAIRTPEGRRKVLTMLRDQEHALADRPEMRAVDWTAPYRDLGLDYDE